MKFTSIVAIAVMFTTVDAIQMKQKAAFNKGKYDAKTNEAMKWAETEKEEIMKEAKEIDSEVKSGDTDKATKTAEKDAKKFEKEVKKAAKWGKKAEAEIVA